MQTGTIKAYDAERGFGFIIPDDGRASDLFVHIKECAKDIEELRPGQRVRFDERPSTRHGGKFEAYAVALMER